MIQSPEGGTTSLPQYLQKRRPLTPTATAPAVQKAPTTAPTIQPPAGQGTKPAPTNVATAAPQPVLQHDPNVGLAKPIVPAAPPPPAATNPFMPARNPADQTGDGVPDDIKNYTLPWGTQRPGVVNDYNQDGQPDAPGTPIKPSTGGIGAVRPDTNPFLQMTGIDMNSPEYAAAMEKQREWMRLNPNAPILNFSGGASASNPFMTSMTSRPTAQAPAGRVGSNGPIFFNDTPGANEYRASQTGVNASAQPSGAGFRMSNFGQFLEQMMGGNRYTDPQIAQMRTQSTNRLDDIRRQEEDRAKVDAARRGVYYGSPLTNSMGDISERYVRGIADSETDLMRYVADANANDRQSNIGNIFKYAQGELDNQTTQASILEKLAQLGMQGGPTLNGAFGSFDNMQGPQGGGVDPAVWEMLGRVFGGGR